MRKKIQIGIAEDHILVRKGLVSMLKDYKHIVTVFEASDGEELYKQLRIFSVSIILLDIKMPVLDGKEALRIIKKNFPAIKIIILSAYAEEDLILNYISLGADGFLPKYCEVDSLVQAINSVERNGFYFEEHILELLERQGNQPVRKTKKLAEREIRVMLYLCENKTHQEISELMGLKEITIAGYKHRLFKKTNTVDVKGLRDYALKYNYL